MGSSVSTYIISGRGRSGTSMMMRSCETGGMDMIYDTYMPPAYDELYKETGYHPNPHGFYEVGSTLLDATDAVGKVLKMFALSIAALPVVEGLTYNIAFMVRPDAEIAMSIKRAFPKTWECIKFKTVPEALELINARDDVLVTMVNYHDVVANPLREFNRLAAAGWPIDAAKAATIPTDELYRNRL